MSIKEKIENVYNANSKSGISKDGFNYFYTCPNPKVYPHQWFWDSCFHIIVNSKLDRIGEAKRELETLLHYQAPNGWIGHMIYWETKFSPVDLLVKRRYPDPEMSPLLQPAFLAHALKYLFDAQNKDNHELAIGVLKNLFDPVKKYYDYVYNNRILYENRPLISIIHPWESGTDNIPKYDKVLGISGRFMVIKWLHHLLKGLKVNQKQDWNIQKIRDRSYFVIEDCLVNSVFTDGLSILSELALILKKEEISNKLKKRSQLMEKAILSELYSTEDGIFYDTYGLDHKIMKIKTVSSFMPLNLNSIPVEITKTLIKKHLLNKEEFNTPYPIPSVEIHNPAFNPKGAPLLWRGPSWICTNWYVIKGLEKQLYLHPELEKLLSAFIKDLKERTINLIEKSGFMEYYNPIDGNGYGADGFSWSGLVIDL